MGAWVDLGSGGLKYKGLGGMSRLEQVGFRESFGLQGQGFRVWAGV